MATICPFNGRKCVNCAHYRESTELYDDYTGKPRKVCYADIDQDYRSAIIAKKKEFVEKLSEIIRDSNPNLVVTEYFCNDYGDETVVVTCDNGYSYTINVTADSLAAIVTDVYSVIKDK